MKMLVLVLNDENMVDDILLGLKQIGIKGATVIDSIGMGGILGLRIPFFPKSNQFVRIQKPDNKTIFTVIDDDNLLQKAVDMLKAQLQLEKPGTGFMFVVPVLEAYGTAEIKGEDD